LPKSTTAADSISLHNTEFNHNILSLYWPHSMFINSKEKEVDYETMAGQRLFSGLPQTEFPKKIQPGIMKSCSPDSAVSLAKEN
jgi:hypothetical protein